MKNPKWTDRQGENVRIINPEDAKYMDRLYIVYLAQYDSGVAVFADCAGDAFESAVEYSAKKGWRVHYLDSSDPADTEAIAELQGFDQLLWADKGLCCDSGDVTIFEIER